VLAIEEVVCNPFSNANQRPQLPRNARGRLCLGPIYSRVGFSGRNDRKHLEVDEVCPLSQPDVEERAVVAFHDLIATPEVLGYPAVHILEAIWCKAAACPEALVDWNWAVPKVLDDHEKH